MARFIFYSWQNDLDCKTHRYFIEKCLKKALVDLKKDAAIYMSYDRDTKGINGSPDITATIFDKIDKCVLNELSRVSKILGTNIADLYVKG
ncbi:MAG: hypothetical protein ACI4JB_00030 [Porcipelethomonas sp.]